MAGDIAIVGVSGCYAGAGDVRSFWQNILDKVDAVGPADAEWTGPYLDPEASRNDRIYTNQGGFLRDLAKFDPVEHGIMPSSVDGGEPDHYLALKLATDALADAGYRRGGYDPERAGVILGRGTYINRGYTTLMQHGMVVDQTVDALRAARPDLSDQELASVREALKAQLPALNAEMAPGLVPNVTTGMIANRLDLMGPNYIIDAACASSLISVELAARELLSGRCSMVLAGGVQAHTPPQLFMIFCQINALSRGRIRPFSSEAGGTLLGEGAGLLVLKRLEDAEADGDRIYAVIKGIGTSSDGRAKGLLAPRFEGEVLALKRAYAAANIDPSTVGLVEAHGTGIKLGDQTEVASLSEVFGSRNTLAPRVALGSVKSMISHCIPAAGSAALIKAALALHHKVLPPTLCDEVNPALELERTPFYINNETRPWVHGQATPRRAGVNAFGFGGINAHVVLEEYQPRASKASVSLPEATQWHGFGGELLVYAAQDTEALIAAIDATVQRIDAAPLPSLGGLARCLAEEAEAATGAGADARLALVATDLADARKQLTKARERLAEGKTTFRTRTGLSAGRGAMPGRIGFLFPGEGAQYPGMLSELAVAYPQVRAWFDFLDRTVADTRDYRPSEAMLPAPNGLDTEQRKALERPLFEMDLASESVFTASQALHALLKQGGVTPEVMVGHSTGENSALVASNTMRAPDMDSLGRIAHALNEIYRDLEQAGRIHSGSLLTVGALDAEARQAALGALGERLTVAMDNCPNQVVYFGDAEAVAAAHEALTAAGGICSELPFGRAYHTPFFAPVAEAFRRYYATVDMQQGDATLYSCSTAAPFPSTPDAMRDVACGQWAQPVRFQETIERLYADGVRVFVEVGPSANLSAFVGDILRGHEDVVSIATNSRRQPAVKQFHSAMAQLWAVGCPMRPTQLFAHRELPETSLAIPEADARRVLHLNLQLPALRFDQDLLPPPAAISPLPSERPAATDAPRPEPAPASASASVQAPRPDAAVSASSAHVASTAAEVHPPATADGPTHAPPSAVEERTASADPRAAWVKGHFALMDAFLANQQRVWAAAAGGALAQGNEQSTESRAHSGQVVAFPMLGEVRSMEGGLEIQRVFRLDADAFLQDHTIGGEPSRHDRSLRPIPVMPFTFSMELVAEAASRLLGEDRRFVAMEEARGHRWLTLDDGTLPLRITVSAEDADTVYGRVFLDRGDSPIPGGMLVFEARVRFAASLPSAPPAVPWGDHPALAPAKNPDDQLYTLGMFHGPRLQGVKRILRWSEDAIDAELEVLPTQDYFEHGGTPAFVFDAALLDAAGQLAGYWLTERHDWGFNCFPFRVGAFRVYAEMPAAGTRIHCRGRLQMTGTQSLSATFDLVLPDGQVLARAEGWEDRTFTVPQRVYDYRIAPTTRFLSQPAAMAAPDGWVMRHLPAFDNAFLEEGGGIWKNMLAHMALNHHERAQYYALPGKGTRRAEWLLGRIAAKEAVRLWIGEHYGVELANADIEIGNDAQGAPYARSGALAGQAMPAISLAHSRGHAVACAAPPGVAPGLDYQRSEQVDLQDVARGALSAEDLRAAGGDGDAVILALWAAKEAAAKALRTGLMGRPLDWRVHRATLDAQGNGSADIAFGEQIVAVLLARVEAQAMMALAATTASSSPTAVQSMRSAAQH
ncbi:MAG: beta-ketoacyl synthase N-terminal-like domain-containing protein [Algiphilus sp.]